jgi:hypothetical protein
MERLKKFINFVNSLKNQAWFKFPLTFDSLCCERSKNGNGLRLYFNDRACFSLNFDVDHLVLCDFPFKNPDMNLELLKVSATHLLGIKIPDEELTILRELAHFCRDLPAAQQAKFAAKMASVLKELFFSGDEEEINFAEGGDVLGIKISFGADEVSVLTSDSTLEPFLTQLSEGDFPEELYLNSFWPSDTGERIKLYHKIKKFNCKNIDLSRGMPGFINRILTCFDGHSFAGDQMELGRQISDLLVKKMLRSDIKAYLPILDKWEELIEPYTGVPLSRMEFALDLNSAEKKGNEVDIPVIFVDSEEGKPGERIVFGNGKEIIVVRHRQISNYSVHDYSPFSVLPLISLAKGVSGSANKFRQDVNNIVFHEDEKVIIPVCWYFPGLNLSGLASPFIYFICKKKHRIILENMIKEKENCLEQMLTWWAAFDPVDFDDEKALESFQGAPFLILDKEQIRKKIVDNDGFVFDYFDFLKKVSKPEKNWRKVSMSFQRQVAQMLVFDKFGNHLPYSELVRIGQSVFYEVDKLSSRNLSPSEQLFPLYIQG